MVKAGLVELSSSLVFQLINTLILFFILKRLLFKPVKGFMDARRNAILESMQEAENKNIEADHLKEQYEEKIAKAQEEGRQIITEASKRAKDKADQIVQEAQQQAMKIKDRAEAEIVGERQKAMNALKDEMVQIAVLAAGKIIDKNLDEKSHKALVKEFINEVGDVKWQN
jgi:F-type H+-transporting ATPase subunit b